MELLQRARESGRVIPSLVTTDNGGTIEVDGFGPDLLALLDGTGTLEVLRSHDCLKIPNSVSLPRELTVNGFAPTQASIFLPQRRLVMHSLNY
jgi:hypothetical protein